VSHSPIHATVTIAAERQKVTKLVHDRAAALIAESIAHQ